jgi:hypothetical protein
MRAQQFERFETGLVVGVVVLGLLSWSSGAFAQKQAPGWAQGRPAELENSPLAPHPGKLTVTPSDQIPIDKLLLPPGL